MDINERTLQEVQFLAQRNPVIAWGLALCGSDEQSFGGEAMLTNAELNVPVPITFQQIPNNCFVRDFTFDLEMPNLAPGNILAPQAQHYTALHPGVDMKIQINQGNGPMNQVLNQDFQPIQHLVRNTAAPSPTCCDWLKGKFIWSWQSLTSSVILRRSLSQGEIPYRLSFGLKVNVLPFQRPGGCGLEEAVNGLSGLGIKVDRARLEQIQKLTGGW